MTDPTYRVVVASDNSDASRKAIRFSVDLCKKLAVAYELEIVYVVALNPSSNPVPVLGQLDKAANIEIKDDAKKDLVELREFVKQFDGVVNYNVVNVEDHTHVGAILEAYTAKQATDILIVGSRKNEGLRKFILGSTSEYCIHHVKCPVIVVKHDHDEHRKAD